jgi:hypothetical protein
MVAADQAAKRWAATIAGQPACWLNGQSVGKPSALYQMNMNDIKL